MRTTTSGAAAPTATADSKDVALATKAVLAKGDLPSDCRYKAATLRSAEYVACWTKAKAETAAKEGGAAPGSAWRAGPVEAGGEAQEAHLSFRYQALVDGKIIDANGYEDILVFRHGRTVVVLAPQAVASEADPSDIDTTTARSLDSAAGRFLERLSN